MYRGPSSAAPQCCTCSVQTLSKRRLAQVFSSAGSVAVLRDSTGVARVVHTLSKRRLTQHRYLAVLAHSPSYATVQVLHVHTLSKRRLPQVRDNSPSYTETPCTLTVQLYHSCNPSSATQHSNVQVVCHRNSAHANSTDVPQLYSVLDNTAHANSNV